MSKPILVMMSYRGGERLLRCLDSIAVAESYFSRIVLSVTADEDSADMRNCRTFQKVVLPRAELICTGAELPTMQHQSFWIKYLQETGTQRQDWIYWLAYDDAVRIEGLTKLTDNPEDWPLEAGIAYLGPWAMRHETADQLYVGRPDDPAEVWTSLPSQGDGKVPIVEWIADQLWQPTYIQMSGSIMSFGSFMDLRDMHPRKNGPMRIEMATALSTSNLFVTELAEPVVTIYGRPNSDRASYGSAARKEDVHLMFSLLRYTFKHPRSFRHLVRILVDQIQFLTCLQDRNPEEWRVRIRPTN